ncbi:GNAT family N-acetyltransferase [Hazenella coriacea]|uniref:GNAT family N-acetyltransferase n=1 Tax=Hazenella coriacea TaxID=1179467 RepID=UPI001FB3F10D|nr:GNAT family N-acetyltransferase [Hazenella coriacea]
MLDKEDAEVYWPCRLRALKEEPFAFGSSYEEARLTPIEQVRQRLESDPNKFNLGAWDEDGRLVGIVTFSRETLIKMQHKANIFAMYVIPEARGKGIARQLLAEVIRRAKQIEGLEKIQLTVAANNVSAVQLYRVLGFETFGVERRALKVQGEYIDEEWMVYHLEP